MTQSFRQIIDRWPSPDALAGRIGAKTETVRKWRQRNSIPAEWWKSVIGAARERDDNLTAHEMAEIAANSHEDAQ
jgi:hypothetical protein